MTDVIGSSIVVEPTYTKSDWDKVNPNKVKEKTIEPKASVKKSKVVESEIDDIVYD